MKLSREQRSTLFIACIFIGGTVLNLCASDELWRRNFSTAGLPKTATRRKSTTAAIKAPLSPVADHCLLGAVQACNTAKINALIAEHYGTFSHLFSKKYATYKAKMVVAEKISRSFFEDTTRYLNVDSFIKKVLGVCNSSYPSKKIFSPLHTIISNNGIDTVYLPIKPNASGRMSLDQTAHCIIVETKFDSNSRRIPVSTKEKCKELLDRSIRKTLDSIIIKLKIIIETNSSSEQTDCAQHAIEQYALLTQALTSANVLHAATVVDATGAMHLYMLTNHGQTSLKDGSIDAGAAELSGRLLLSI